MPIKHIIKAIFIFCSGALGIFGLYVVAPLFQFIYDDHGPTFLLFLVNVMSVLALVFVVLMVSTAIAHLYFFWKYKEIRKEYWWFGPWIIQNKHISFHPIKASTGLFVHRWWIVNSLIEDVSTDKIAALRSDLYLEHILVLIVHLAFYFLLGSFLGYTLYLVAVLVLIWIAYLMNAFDQTSSNAGDYVLLSQPQFYKEYYRVMLSDAWSSLGCDCLKRFDLVNHNIFWMVEHKDVLSHQEIDRLFQYFEEYSIFDSLTQLVNIREAVSYAHALFSMRYLCYAVISCRMESFSQQAQDLIETLIKEDELGLSFKEFSICLEAIKQQSLSGFKIKDFRDLSSFRYIGPYQKMHQKIVSDIEKNV